MGVLETERLSLRWLCVDDAPFMLELLNEPSFIRYIGDRGVRTLEQARKYVLDGPVASYERFGFGLYLVTLREDGAPIGVCGLLKREVLDDVDVGFAFLPRFWGQGYALEAASAVMTDGRERFGFERIVAITDPDNAGSIRVLEKLGFRFEELVRLQGFEGESRLFGWGVTRAG
jgi:RimJ/RimL family protein N-acetyltransferase